ncbi:hypothetical protein RND71_039671 [Anisodus tanguticus]|uniref:Uncharacterized protein n=1 Tax=Anisodus tanguticus TaxID=243964 RepID=A0AAE1UXZ8_9SOLA|nr:hypothetical protein RND71_039671 [Anisodus tanguticus]
MEEGADVTNMQGQNESKGKRIMGLNEKDDEYGSREKENNGIGNNAGEDISTISIQCLDMGLKKEDVLSKLLVDINIFDDTIRGSEDVSQLNTKELQEKKNQSHKNKRTRQYWPVCILSTSWTIVSQDKTTNEQMSKGNSSATSLPSARKAS